MIKLTKAIDRLIEFDVIQKGIGRERYIITARKETYMKTPPATIRRNANMLSYLQSIGINIDTMNMRISSHHYQQICN
jgi:hypothetical protein